MLKIVEDRRFGAALRGLDKLGPELAQSADELEELAGQVGFGLDRFPEKKDLVSRVRKTTSVLLYTGCFQEMHDLWCEEYRASRQNFRWTFISGTKLVVTMTERRVVGRTRGLRQRLQEELCLLSKPTALLVL